jgi:hypothetical protein
VTNYLLTKYELRGDFTGLHYLRINALGDHALLLSKHICHLRKKALEPYLYFSDLSKAAPQLKTIDFISTKTRHFFFSGKDPSSTLVCPQLPRSWMLAFINLAQ